MTTEDALRKIMDARLVADEVRVAMIDGWKTDRDRDQFAARLTEAGLQLTFAATDLQLRS
jgi:hypothetical protein